MVGRLDCRFSQEGGGGHTWGDAVWLLGARSLLANYWQDVSRHELDCLLWLQSGFLRDKRLEFDAVRTRHRYHQLDRLPLVRKLNSLGPIFKKHAAKSGIVLVCRDQHVIMTHGCSGDPKVIIR